MGVGIVLRCQTVRASKAIQIGHIRIADDVAETVILLQHDKNMGKLRNRRQRSGAHCERRRIARYGPRAVCDRHRELFAVVGRRRRRCCI